MSVISQKTGFQIRPRFEERTSQSIEDVSAAFRTELSEGTCPFNGKVKHGYVSLYPKDKDRHYWSPHFSMTMEADEDDPETTVLYGLYGPSPPVWTLFVFVYSFLALFVVIVAVIGFANRSIGDSGAILWLLPVLLLMLASLYFVSYFGQKKGHDQIEDIHHYIEEVLNLQIR